jgi:hypothetical protein
MPFTSSELLPVMNHILILKKPCLLNIMGLIIKRGVGNAAWSSPTVKIGVYIADKVGAKAPVVQERFNRNLIY